MKTHFKVQLECGNCSRKNEITYTADDKEFISRVFPSETENYVGCSNYFNIPCQCGESMYEFVSQSEQLR